MMCKVAKPQIFVIIASCILLKALIFFLLSHCVDAKYSKTYMKYNSFKTKQKKPNSFLLFYTIERTAIDNTCII